MIGAHHLASYRSLRLMAKLALIIVVVLVAPFVLAIGIANACRGGAAR